MADSTRGEYWRVLARSGAARQGLESRLMEHGKLGPPIHSACRVCRGVAGLERFDRGRTIAGQPLARRCVVAMRGNGFWVVDGVYY